MIKKALKKYLFDNRVPNPVNVTFSQKQSIGGLNHYKAIDGYISSNNFRYFKNILNKKVFGNTYKRFNKKLKMVVIAEGGDNLRHHLHTIIEKPKNLTLDVFKKLIRYCWNKTLLGYEQIHIEKPTTQQREDGWLHYILKERTKIDLTSSIDWENTHL